MNKFQKSLLYNVIKQYADLIKSIAEKGITATPEQRLQFTNILADLDSSAKVLNIQIEQCKVSPEKCNAVILYHCACLGRVKTKVKNMGVKV